MLNERLGKLTVKAMAKTRMNIREVAVATGGVSESWVKQMRGGRIERPEAAKLVRLANALGADPKAFLAAADQLGASIPASRTDAEDPLVTELRSLVTEMREQNRVLLALVSIAYPDLMDALAHEREALEALVKRRASVEGTSLSLDPTPESSDTPERSEPTPLRPRPKARK